VHRGICLAQRSICQTLPFIVAGIDNALQETRLCAPAIQHELMDNAIVGGRLWVGAGPEQGNQMLWKVQAWSVDKLWSVSSSATRVIRTLHVDARYCLLSLAKHWQTRSNAESARFCTGRTQAWRIAHHCSYQPGGKIQKSRRAEINLDQDNVHLKLPVCGQTLHGHLHITVLTCRWLHAFNRQCHWHRTNCG
jgi:hypothetical protein